MREGGKVVKNLVFKLFIFVFWVCVGSWEGLVIGFVLFFDCFVKLRVFCFVGLLICFFFVFLILSFVICIFIFFNLIGLMFKDCRSFIYFVFKIFGLFVGLLLGVERVEEWLYVLYYLCFKN